MSSMISRAFIDDLIGRVDIVDFINSYVPLRKMGHNHVACCPFHSEKTPSFTVSAHKQFYYCFGCGAHGNAIGFLMAYRHLEFLEAVTELAARMGLEVPRTGSAPLKPQQNIYTLMQKVTQAFQKQLMTSPHHHPVSAYLKTRDLNNEIIEAYQLGYAPPGWHFLSQSAGKEQALLREMGLILEKNGRYYDRYRARLIFPIHNRQGQILGFGGRALNPEETPKYLNSPETSLFHKSRVLYGLYQAIQKNPKPAYLWVVEGYMDVIALAQYGISEAVATLGTATSTEHIQLLSRHTDHILFCFDGDLAGKKAAWKALTQSLSQLLNNVHISFVFLPEGEDPDSLVRKEGKTRFLERIQSAKHLQDFFFEYLSEGLDLTQMAGRTRLIDRARPYLNTLPAGSTYYPFLLEGLSLRVHIAVHRVEKLIGQTHTSKQVTKDAEKTAHGFHKYSEVCLALALLIQNPELVQHIAYTPAQEACSDEEKLFYEVSQYISQNPKTRTGILLEHYREHREFNLLNELAFWDRGLSDSGNVHELIGVVRIIEHHIKDRQIQKLLNKAQSGLSSEEQRLLRDMIQTKRTSKTPKH